MTGKRENDTARTEKPAITLPGPSKKSYPLRIQLKLKRHRSQWMERIICIERFGSDKELQDENGRTVSLKPGVHVEVTIEADEKQHVLRSRATERGFSESSHPTNNNLARSPFRLWD
jgi:hypothetical protein